MAPSDSSRHAGGAGKGSDRVGRGASAGVRRHGPRCPCSPMAEGLEVWGGGRVRGEEGRGSPKLLACLPLALV